MKKNQTEIIFFLQYRDKKNSTLEDQTGFMLWEMDEEEECQKIGGKVFTNSDFYNTDPKEVVREALRKERPKWVVGIENTATILLSYKRQKKILINPTVTMNDLRPYLTKNVNAGAVYFRGNLAS